MATIATLNVLIKATTAPFKKALRSASASAKKFGKSIAAIGKRVAKFGALVATGAVVGLVALTKQAFTAIDSMAKLSGAIGISTDKLAGFQLAAELGGISTQAMDKALKKMVRGIGQAGQGLSTQVKAFKALGLTFDELKTKTPADQFAIISERMRELGTASERAAIAADIFGKAGIDLLNIFAGGAEGLQKAQEAADALGLSMSNVDAKQVENANDAFLQVKRALTGIGRQIAIGVAPVVEFLSKKFTDAATAGEGIRGKVGGALNFVIKAIGGVLDVVNFLQRGWLGAQAIILQSLEGLAMAFNDFVQIAIDGINKLLPKSKELANVNRFAERGFAAARAEVEDRFSDLLSAPSGKEQGTKFFNLVTAESKKAAIKAVAAQKAAFQGPDLGR